MYLGGVDQPPGTEQAEPMLVAVVEAGAVGLPICIGVILKKHTLFVHVMKTINGNEQSK